jgi:hypothetical protein
VGVTRIQTYLEIWSKAMSQDTAILLPRYIKILALELIRRELSEME